MLSIALTSVTSTRFRTFDKDDWLRPEQKRRKLKSEQWLLTAGGHRVPERNVRERLSRQTWREARWVRTAALAPPSALFPGVAYSL